MNYGVTPQGFIRKPYDTLLSEMQALAQSSEYFGSTIDLSDESPVGIDIKLMSYALSRQWQLAEDVYYSFDLDASEGAALVRLTKLGFVEKKDEQYATGYLTFHGEAEREIPAGTQAETKQGIVFSTIVSSQTDSEGNVTIAAKCLTAGTAGNVAAGSITSIKTPVPGISTVANFTSFAGGMAMETDAGLRDRFENTQLASGSSLPAIEAQVLELEGVSAAKGYENVENYTDENGLPPKSISIIALGGNEDIIAELIFQKKAAGINTHGTISKIIIDSHGNSHTIKFSRPEEVQVYVRYVLDVNSNYNPADESTIKSVAVESINGLSIASQAYAWKLCNLLQNIEGLDNVKAYLGLSAGNTTLDKITPDIDQILKTASSQVVIEYE